MKLLFIAATSAEGDSLDLFVEAGTLEQAKTLWTDYYGSGCCDNAQKFKVFDVPAPTGIPAAFGWFEEVKRINSSAN